MVPESPSQVQEGRPSFRPEPEMLLLEDMWEEEGWLCRGEPEMREC